MVKITLRKKKKYESKLPYKQADVNLPLGLGQFPLQTSGMNSNDCVSLLKIVFIYQIVNAEHHFTCVNMFDRDACGESFDFVQDRLSRTIVLFFKIRNEF